MALLIEQNPKHPCGDLLYDVKYSMFNNRVFLWSAALLAAALATWILYSALPGLNWGIWVAATSAGLLFVRFTARKRLALHTLSLLGWATAIAFAQGVTAVPGHTPLIFATVAILLGIAVVTLDDSAGGITLPSAVQVPFSAVSRVAKRSMVELVSLTANAHGFRDQPVLRGILFALPVALILISLLSSADPILDSIRQGLLGWMDNWVIDGRIVFFLVSAFVTLGAYAMAVSNTAQLAPPLYRLEPPFRVGPSEERIVLGAVNAVLWVFVLLQLFSLTRNPGGSAGTGTTYAEYARQGFAELSIAAAIVLGLILFLEVFRSREAQPRRRTDLAAIVAVELILVSAFRRVILYEVAYGYTTDRLIAQAYMLVLACAFVLLAWDLRKGAVSSAFGRRGMVLTLIAVTAFTYWNYEGWIVRENLDRARHGAQLDLPYLERLSAAAVPALIENRSAFTDAQWSHLEAGFRCRSRIPEAQHWYEWNLRRERARSALRFYEGECKREGLPPVTSSGVPSQGESRKVH